MTEILANNHLLGLVIGMLTFLIIGLFHPLVIKGEYYFGTGCWWCFLIAGILFTGLSLWADDVMLAAVFGVLGFSSFWSMKEVFEQTRRVEKGWFPANPKRKKSTTTIND